MQLLGTMASTSKLMKEHVHGQIFAEANIMAGSNLDYKVSRVTSAQWKEVHPESTSRPT